MSGQRLIGRDRELAVLDSLLAAAGGSLLVTGEPGIGKSALLEAAAGRARAAGFLVLSCIGASTETHLPFAGLHQLLSPLRAEISELTAADRDVLRAALGEIASGEGGGALTAVRVAGAVLGLLAEVAERAPVLLVIDDVHWLDAPTCAVLAFTVGRLAADPVVLIAAGRDAELRGNPLDAARLPGLRLEPLADAEAGALLDQRLRGTGPVQDPVARGRLLAWAAGNPLALVELPAVARELAALDVPGSDRIRPASEAADGLDGIPWSAPRGRLPVTERLERAFAARLAALPAASRAALLVAALSDNGKLTEVLAATGRLTGTRATAAGLGPAVSAGLVRLDGDDDEGAYVRFRHPLMRAAVHNAAGVAERHDAHRALAAVLGDSPDRQVWHRAACATEPDEELTAALAELAWKAADRGAQAIAGTYLELAAHLSDSATERGNCLV
jgi:hypothetical protein